MARGLIHLDGEWVLIITPETETRMDEVFELRGVIIIVILASQYAEDMRSILRGNRLGKGRFYSTWYRIISDMFFRGSHGHAQATVVSHMSPAASFGFPSRCRGSAR